MIIDTHCHYNSEPLLSEIETHWKNSLSHGVVGGICIGTDINNSNIALQLAQKFSNMFATIAIHPEEYTEQINSILVGDSFTEETIQNILNTHTKEFEGLLDFALAKDNKKIVGIGEIGLDYYRLKVKGIKRNLVEHAQKQIFQNQLELAFQHTLPVILHVRDQADRTESNAYYDTFNIVSKITSQYQKEQRPIPAIILHCASGPKDYIQNFIDLGAYIGFAGNVTYANAPELRQILEMTPKDKILLETDAPYLAPNEKKGQVCEPYFITETAKFLQDKFQINLDIILANTLKVFPEFQKVVQ